MEQTRLLIVAMADRCRTLVFESEADGPDLPDALGLRQLLRMCDRISERADDWPEARLHRWLGFVQAGMLANHVVDIDGVKDMFEEAKRAHGELSDDLDLIDHLDPGSSFGMELGGES